MQTIVPNAPPRKIVLAVDAFGFSPEMAHRTARELRRLFGERLPTVQPVFVLTPDSTLVPLQWFDEAVPKFKAQAAARLLETLEGAAGIGFERPEILVDPRGSIPAVVERINEYAVGTGASLVVIPTARKTPLRRLFLGSFSETMLQRSLVPILTIGPDVPDEARGRRTCLAAVDLADGELGSSVDRIISLAQAAGDVDLVFLHVMPPSLSQMPSTAHPLLIDPRSLIGRQLPDSHLRALESLDELAKQAESRGCRASARMMITTLPVPQAIVEAASAERAALIALSSRSTAMTWLVRRSVARGVMRSSVRPVWTLPGESAATTAASALRPRVHGFSQPAFAP